ncbi:hypothetical protein L596_006056 [Steinernema carpocapsae]|uniref:Chromo domain-containing protein n=1 Tax=Steinernema carpocapsae TaxID=34508 RepID=A0A4U8V0Z1_STECR|nr:hypothetical protein L596_006056 [Steinernema carpocapsae]
MSRKVSRKERKQGEEAWEVEAVQNVCFCLEMKEKRYEVKWKDFPESENTWEPRSCLMMCEHLVDEFLKTNFGHVRNKKAEDEEKEFRKKHPQLKQKQDQPGSSKGARHETSAKRIGGTSAAPSSAGPAAKRGRLPIMKSFMSAPGSRSAPRLQALQAANVTISDDSSTPTRRRRARASTDEADEETIDVQGSNGHGKMKILSAGRSDDGHTIYTVKFAGDHNRRKLTLAEATAISKDSVIAFLDDLI